MKFFICIAVAAAWAGGPVGFWNLENFFDYFDSATSASDTEFSSRGERHWTKKKFYDKALQVGKGILYCGSCSGDGGGGIPSVFGVAEVENAFVLRKICESDVLRKYNYSYVHFDSPDPRGIDVGLLYCRDSVELVQARPIGVGKTRDILYATLRYKGRDCHFFVNHHPSKYSGTKATVARRQKAMTVLMNVVDSLVACGQTDIIAMGDFNDTPYGEAFEIAEKSLVNLGAEYLEALPPLQRANTGTIRYQGKWELIDNFLVYGEGRYEMKAVRIPFLMQTDKSHPGEKPRRTFIGPRYNAGVSDHLPIVLLPAKSDF